MPSFQVGSTKKSVLTSERQLSDRLVPPGASVEANNNPPVSIGRLLGRCLQAPHSKAWRDSEVHNLKWERFRMDVGRNFFLKTAREWHRLPRKLSMKVFQTNWIKPLISWSDFETDPALSTRLD